VAAPATFGVADRTPLIVLHGVGAQIYAYAAEMIAREPRVSTNAGCK
jgi:hypothetical protein